MAKSQEPRGKRPRGLLIAKYGDSLPPRSARMRMAVLRSCALDIQRLALLLGPWQPSLALATSPWPLATTAISSSSLAAISTPPPIFFRTAMSFIPIEARSSRGS
jgi:hypothetical protein